MAYTYDSENIFAKILRGEIPNKTVLETEHTLAFLDIQPQAPTHILVIPKGPYVCFDHFAQEASEPEITDYVRAIGEICKAEGLEENGFRLIANAGREGVQDVPHLHVHILAGRVLGPMLARAK
ncbi:MAG: histidine triad nucleotide-binding protein [Pelagimonas sp.]|jgi:histidine triad (HIT) family protein|nr:histidine triad nucleotide-binding protein [Pelagimonas sp.]